jgi:hypothetical protein
LPGAAPPLDDAQTGLRQIIRYLLTPCQSGLYLTRQDIERLARELQLPPGFGRREEMLRNVWDAAAQHDRVPALLPALQVQLGRWQHTYDFIQSTYPELRPFTRAWQTRAQQTEQFLAALLSRLPAG